MLTNNRKSFTAPNKIYFWTATIHKWHHLLEDDTVKQIIINSLKVLSDRNIITVYAFVIMPNHRFYKPSIDEFGFLNNLYAELNGD